MRMFSQCPQLKEISKRSRIIRLDIFKYLKETS